MGLENIAASIKNIDRFGTLPTFHIRNKPTFTTWVGAIATLVIYGITAIYAVQKGNRWLNREDMNYSSFTETNGFRNGEYKETGLNIFEKKMSIMLGFGGAFADPKVHNKFG